MTNFENGVPFDPGFAPYVVNFSESIKTLKNELSNYKTIHQKKFRFKVFEPHIRKLFENICAFYLGCLLWAGYIYNKFKDNPQNITGNSFLDINKDKLDQYDFLYEVNFLQEYIEQFDKDCKYFLGKPANLPELYSVIANEYKKFLEINVNFTNTKLTADLKAPDSLNHFTQLSGEKLDKLYSFIENSIKNGKIESLLEIGFYKDKE